MTTRYRFDRLLAAEGWLAPGWLGIGADGTIEHVGGTPPDEAASVAVRGIALPGMTNLHSHAFQRAFAGLAERGGSAEDSFWTWREVMYRFVARLTPDAVEAIAAQLYVEMLKAGFTAVAEFHYLHHDSDGRRYPDPAEMALRHLAAAHRTGIAITMLPVLYAASGFGGRAPEPAQRRFVNDLDGWLAILAAVERAPYGHCGLALHSLRAVPPDLLAAAVRARDTAMPIHIHVAEQEREVAECLAWSGARPVEWLLANAPVDARWCLVHATHMTDSECDALARSGAVAGLCPTTEANLGDGVFPLARLLAANGRFGIGSDSHVSVSPVEELRWLEYGQRLMHRRRNVAAGGAGASTGMRLWRGAAEGGAAALGQPVGALAPGRRADLIVLDSDHPMLAGRAGDDIVDTALFAGSAALVRDVMVGGRWVVRDGHHAAEEATAAAYRAAVTALLD